MYVSASIRVDNLALVRDSFGDVALRSRAGEASWSLLDNLGSTAAQAVGGQVTDLASYSAWGVQMFESSGWDAVTGFTGERTDPGYGLNNYFSRTYDPSTGVWLSQDSWRGLIEQPQSLARYGYVMANPMTLIDYMGYSGCPAVSYQTGCPAKKIKPQKPINCARDMKVGMDARQIEINRYCGGLLAEKSVKEVGGWQEETWRWTRVIDRWLSPSVYLIQIASLASFGSGVRSPGSRTSFIPEVHIPRPPLKPRAAPANAVKPDAKIVFGQNPNQISHTFRHVLDGGLSEAAVKQSVLADLSWRAGMFSGQYTGTVIVQGKVLYYSAFQLPGGLINVGRITIGR